LHAGRIRRVLEMPAALAALQFQRPAFRGVPERLRPLIRHRDRPDDFAPVAHRVCSTSFLSRRRPRAHERIYRADAHPRYRPAPWADLIRPSTAVDVKAVDNRSARWADRR